MTTLVDWLGKAEDLSISYDAGVPQNSPLLEGRLVTESDLPALLYTPNDNVREVTDASWEESVEKAGSSSTAGKGTGIPGPIVSLIKELSVIPCFKDKTIGETEFHTWVSKLFNGTLLAKRDDNGKILKPVKFDLRTEIGLLHEVGRQFIPVLLNECLVRGLYFLRRLQTAFVKGKNQKTAWTV